MSERQGIEIDYCPTCRGVWLDRGELDKIIERTVNEEVPQMKSDERFRRQDDYHKYGHKKKRESFLGDLFDF
jgi:Zn-finger nucleic acid-binding protein